MNHDQNLENAAHGIKSLEERELFCRSMGGHCSVDHKKNFRFPNNEVEKGEDGTWKAQTKSAKFVEQYKSYDHTLIGRALMLNKLEEAAKVRHDVDVDGISKSSQALVDVARTFDKRVTDIIHEWRSLIISHDRPSMMYLRDYEEIVSAIIEKLNNALTILKEHEVDLPCKHNRKKKHEDDDSDFSPEIAKRSKKNQGGGLNGRHNAGRSPARTPRRTNARLQARELFSRHVGEGSGSWTK